jgi:hypothetical protein
MLRTGRGFLFALVFIAAIAGRCFAPALAKYAPGTPPIPMPAAVEDVEFDGESGKLEFYSTSSVETLATFFRTTLKPLGWKEETSVINRANMVVLDFNKEDKDLSFTIMQLGAKVNVSANGSGLITAAAEPPPPVAPQDLEAEEMEGLPVPTLHTQSAGEKTPFRRALTASVPADLAAVLGFYRRELGKRSWKEETQGALVTAERVALAFTSPDGPAILKLGRKGRETTVNLVVRDQAAAAKAGILPKPGQAKILFGNAQGTEAVITIDKQAVKIPPGAGTKGPDGPTLDLAPGKYKYSFKAGSAPAGSDEVEVGADETWGLLAGPGGVLALQMY